MTSTRNDILLDIENQQIDADENGNLLYLSDFVSTDGIYAIRVRGSVGFIGSSPQGSGGEWYIAIEEHTESDGDAGLTVLNSYVSNDPPTEVPLTGAKFRIQAAFTSEAPGYSANISAVVRALPS